MTMSEAAEIVALRYIKAGMAPGAAVDRACHEVTANAVSAPLGDLQEGWDTFTTYAPWIGAGIAAWLLYRGTVKVKRAGSAYIDRKRRQTRAAKAAWDAAY
jgi:hypothetical protein